MEGAVAHLAQGTAVLVLGPLVAALATHDEVAAVDLDGHVVSEVDAGQLEPDNGVVAVTGNLGGGGEAGLAGGRAERVAHKRVEVGERVTPGPQRHSLHGDLLAAQGERPRHLVKLESGRLNSRACQDIYEGDTCHYAQAGRH